MYGAQKNLGTSLTPTLVAPISDLPAWFCRRIRQIFDNTHPSINYSTAKLVFDKTPDNLLKLELYYSCGEDSKIERKSEKIINPHDLSVITVIGLFRVARALMYRANCLSSDSLTPQQESLFYAINILDDALASALPKAILGNLAQVRTSSYIAGNRLEKKWEVFADKNPELAKKFDRGADHVVVCPQSKGVEYLMRHCLGGFSRQPVSVVCTRDFLPQDILFAARKIFSVINPDGSANFDELLKNSGIAEFYFCPDLRRISPYSEGVKLPTCISSRGKPQSSKQPDTVNICMPAIKEGLERLPEYVNAWMTQALAKLVVTGVLQAEYVAGNEKLFGLFDAQFSNKQRLKSLRQPLGWVAQDSEKRINSVAFARRVLSVINHKLGKQRE